MSFPALRKRRPSENVITGGLVRIFQGAFGIGDAGDELSSSAQVGGQRGIYHFHEGDLFTPGTGNWVLDPSLEVPLNTIWGNAFLRTPNTFNPIQPPQVYANQTVSTVGLGGLVAGQIIFQPLQEPAPEQG